MNQSKAPNPWAVPNNIREQAAYETARNGYLLEAICHQSNHPDDNYLFNVVASNQSKATKADRFVKWSFNSSTGALNHGHYNLTESEAVKKLINHTAKNPSLYKQAPSSYMDR